MDIAITIHMDGNTVIIQTIMKYITTVIIMMHMGQRSLFIHKMVGEKQPRIVMELK